MFKTELHRHLDVSTRTSTILELAQSFGLEAQSTSLESFRQKFYLRLPLQDLEHVLAKFVLCQNILRTPEIFERIAFEVAEDCFHEGLTRVELRYSPSFACEKNGLTWNETLEAFERGLARARVQYPALSTGLICIASRDYGLDAVEKTVEFFLKNQTRFLAIDLAGNETGFPCKQYRDAFAPVRASGAKVTIHAGEAEGPDNIWSAIEDLGARRIGHGVRCVDDPKLMDYLRDYGICLENCLFSNWITQASKTLEQHPLPKILRHGIPVCLSTDDPGVFGNTMAEEWQIASGKLGLNPTELQKLEDYAALHSFLVY